MAGKTKAELQADVLMLDPSADVEGLTNAELTDLLAELETAGHDDPKGYTVAEGQAINTLAGLKQSGEALLEQYFVNGADDLKLLIEAGFVVELT